MATRENAGNDSRAQNQSHKKIHTAVKSPKCSKLRRWAEPVGNDQCAAFWSLHVLSSCLKLQWEWGWFPGWPHKLCPPMPFDPIFIPTKTHHEPVKDGASAAEDEQTDHLHRRQTALVQCHWDHLQRGLCYRWDVRQLPSTSVLVAQECLVYLWVLDWNLNGQFQFSSI